MKKILLILGDITTLYLSLYLALLLRGPTFSELVGVFSLIFFIYIIVFYISGLYDLEINQNRLSFYSLFWKVIAINTLIAIFIFYLQGSGPKTILLLQVVFFAFLFSAWRYLFRIILKKFPENVLVIGKTKPLKHPDYNFIFTNKVFSFKKLIKEKKIKLVVVASNPYFNPATIAELFNCLPIKFMTLPDFYELAFKKIPITNLSKVWFLENVSEKRTYEAGKRIFDFILGCLIIIAIFPAWLIISLLIKWDSTGPIFYKQERLGKNNKKIVVWKFRTMMYNASLAGPQWTQKKDPRVTKIGRFLRKSHLDETPQLINIIKGEMSFVGPRAEPIRKRGLQFYSTRHISKPGVTGWAQIKFPQGVMPEHGPEKLSYDLYYIKNRSLVLDLGIILRTIKIILGMTGN